VLIVDCSAHINPLKWTHPRRSHDVQEAIEFCPNSVEPELWACPWLGVQIEQKRGVITDQSNLSTGSAGDGWGGRLSSQL